MRRLLVPAVLLVLSCGGAQEPAPPPLEEPLEIETGVAAFGQSEIYYEVAGTGEMTVILIHGGLLDCTMWDDQFELLANDYRVVRYDADAHGKSPLPPDMYWDHASLRELMDHLGIERAVLVGLSLGGRVAIDMALEGTGTS
jgi:pimeloyl-ACP methyl ester carboxylesterase